MPAPKPISREYRIYLALWRKALTSDFPVTFKCSNFAMGVAIRQGMYRAIKPFRYNEIEDTELKLAAEKFVIRLVKNYGDKEPNKENHQPSLPHWIELVERKTLAEMTDMLDELGIEEDDLYIGDERVLADKLKKLIDNPEPSKLTKTKFYERD